MNDALELTLTRSSDPLLDQERLTFLRTVQELVMTTLREHYAVRVQPVSFTLQESLSPRYASLPFTVAAGETIANVNRLRREIALLTHVRFCDIVQDAHALWLVLPRPKPENVFLRDFLPRANRPTSLGVAAIGVSLHNDLVALDLTAAPHTLVVGTSGSGKSNVLRSIIVSLAYWSKPRDVNFILFDGKGGERFDDFARPHATLAHLRRINGEAVVYTEPAAMLAALQMLLVTMRQRHQAAKLDPATPKPLIFLVIDELAEVLKGGGDQFQEALGTLLWQGRSAGIHVIASAPKADKASLGGLGSFFNGRVVLKTVRPSDAWLATNTGGSNAQSLNLGGDMLVGSTQERTQGFWVADEDVQDLLAPSLIVPARVPALSMGEFGSQLMTGIIVTTHNAQTPEAKVQEPALSLPNGSAVIAHVGKVRPLQPMVQRPLQATGRPRKPITEEEIAMALQWYREHGTLPTQSGLIKGKVLDHCLSTERALRLLGEVEQRIINSTATLGGGVMGSPVAGSG
jgi:DNA segregation ATPase FtsK/SpoIIIE, S-DNA-T family